MSEWKQVKLDEIADIIDSMHQTPKYVHKGQPLVRVTDLKNSYIDLTNCLQVSDDVFETYSKKHKSEKGDIVFARVGSYGNIGLVDKPMDFCIGQNTCFIVPKQNPLFLYYYLLSPLGKTEIEANVGGSTQPTISLKNIKNFDINLPSLFEQQAIAGVLSVLDDKIDLLQRQNKTLEQMAATLFRQWFIEEAKEDWKYVELGSVIETASGGTPSRSNMDFYDNGSICWVKSKELNGSFILQTEEKITENAINSSAAKILPKYSTLIAMYGATVGEFALISQEMACNQAVCALKENDLYPYTFLFMFARWNKEELINQAVGSAQQNISQVLIKKLQIPKCEIQIAKYHSCVLPMFQKIEVNTQQIHTLQSLRDTLLPKLISGEVRLKGFAEKVDGLQDAS